jgi:hypothetical protein
MNWFIEYGIEVKCLYFMGREVPLLFNELFNLFTYLIRREYITRVELKRMCLQMVNRKQFDRKGPGLFEGTDMKC